MNKLTYSSWVPFISMLVSWLSWRYSILSCTKFVNFSGISLKLLLERSNLMRPVHLDIVLSSVCLILVPAKINSFSEAGSLIKELICIYYSWVVFFIYLLWIKHYITYTHSLMFMFLNKYLDLLITRPFSFSWPHLLPWSPSRLLIFWKLLQLVPSLLV